ncbi:MAG: hypothetical protein NXH75_15540 [Halobacteriovoraceae bacterium]|nr:hypothetical protein [Halobacteriovoraceae bacterium]
MKSLSLLTILCVLLLIGSSTFAVEGPTVNFYITVDWEGVDFKTGILDDEDLSRVQSFREKYPNYPMVHYLNAAYYTNGDLTEAEVTKRIKEVLIPTDEIGLHLHPWENLVDHLEIPFISGPTYFGKEYSPAEGPGNAKYPKGHRGGDIPLWSYSKEDIRKMIRFSVQKLNEHGFENITGFRAGGWQTDEKVLQVLMEEGFLTESSPVPFQKVANLYPNTPLEKNVTRLWEGTNQTSQPYLFEKDGKTMLMMPNNAGLADYVDSEEFIEVLKENLKGKTVGDEIHIVYGFHFETAVEYMDNLERSIDKMENLAKRMGFKLNPNTYEKVLSPIKQKLFKDSSCAALLRGLL